ncbi:hypothetical protein Ddc_12010 [Ditylenchus destructor]|nr:hypothetical protein Ddc_12010 [Ditylenchus destructor]
MAVSEDGEKSTEAMLQIYSFVKLACDKCNIYHRYSPECCLAMDLTLHYDELAFCIPVFGRLRELSKLVAVVNIMALLRQMNLDAIKTFKALFGHSVEELISDLQCSEVDNLAQLKAKELWHEHVKIFYGQIEEWITYWNETIPQEAEKSLGRAYSSHSMRILHSNFITEKREAFSTEMIDGLFPSLSSDAFMRAMNGDRNAIDRIVKLELAEALYVALLKLENIINWGTGRFTPEAITLNAGEAKEEAFKKLNFALDREEEENVDNVANNECLWVPAVTRHDCRKHVYGGVHIKGQARQINSGSKTATFLEKREQKKRQLRQNRLNGKAIENGYLNYCTSKGIKVDRQVCIKTPWGKRFLDFVHTDKSGTRMQAIELKFGKARYKGTLQEKKDIWIANDPRYGFKVVVRRYEKKPRNKKNTFRTFVLNDPTIEQAVKDHGQSR